MRAGVGSYGIFAGERYETLYVNNLGFYVVWWPRQQQFGALEREIVEMGCNIDWDFGKDKEW